MISPKRWRKLSSHYLLGKSKGPLTLVPAPVALWFKYLAGLSDLGRWLRSRTSAPHFANKLGLCQHIAWKCLGDEPIDYLEFGVAGGGSLRAWCSLNRRPESRFFGFDSFEGLPEDWSFPTGTVKKGSYACEPPLIDDSRVQIVQGLFQDSLPGFLKSFVPANRLVLHLDADLYSSTMYVLATLNSHLGPGTVLILDDFATVTDVFRALTDYVTVFRHDCRLLGSSGAFYDTAAVEIVTEAAK